jgi:hypothetical protein
MNAATVRLSHVLSVSVFAFILGGWTFFLSGACSELHSGGKWIWIGAVGSVVGLAVSMTALVRDALRPQT